MPLGRPGPVHRARLAHLQSFDRRARLARYCSNGALAKQSGLTTRVTETYQLQAAWRI